MLEVLEVGGVFSLALPDKRYCYDKFRNITDVPIMIDHWLREQSIPSPFQLYDFLSRSVDGSGNYGERAFDVANSLDDARRHYTDEQALNFAINSWDNGIYFDAHCSVFTPESFVKVFSEISRLGIMNVEISQPIEGHEEFFVSLKKLGAPKIIRPRGACGNQREDAELHKKLAHAEKAFLEAVEVQNKLKKYNLLCIANKLKSAIKF